MIHRFTLAAIAAVFALTGCAKPAPSGPVADFTSGGSLVTVTHVPSPTEDGTTVFITVDGHDAGALTKGESLTLSVPAGSHEIGGYARSLIGRVTISPVKVTTNGDTVKHVVYTVTKNKAEFAERQSEPVVKEQAKAAETKPAETKPAEAQPAAKEQPQQANEQSQVPAQEPVTASETTPAA